MIVIMKIKKSHSIGLLLLILLTSCKKHDDSGQGTNEIWLEYKIFHPGQLVISAGTTINFINKDGSSHTVSGSLFNSGTIKPENTYSYTFSTVGTHYFSCLFHQNNTEQINIKVQ
jgi:plastocyanin